MLLVQKEGEGRLFDAFICVGECVVQRSTKFKSSIILHCWHNQHAAAAAAAASAYAVTHAHTQRHLARRSVFDEAQSNLQQRGLLLLAQLHVPQHALGCHAPKRNEQRKRRG